MREILFRGKRLDNGEWVEGYFCNESCASLTGPTFEEANIIRKGSVFWHPVNPKTVGQYTGLVDKNGKKIFEGDTVLITERIGSVTGVVIFENGYPGGWLVADKNIKHKCSLAMRTDIKVTGNIHDNPELMGGGE